MSFFYFKDAVLPFYSEKNAKRLLKKRFWVFFREEAKIPMRPPPLPSLGAFTAASTITEGH
jgi:hypothetical protein